MSLFVAQDTSNRIKMAWQEVLEWNPKKPWAS